MAISHRSRRTHLARPTPMFAVEAQQLLAADQATEAVELCKRGLIYYPGHVTGYVVLSQAYLDLGERERALNVLQDGYRRTGAEKLDQIRTELAEKAAEAIPFEAEEPRFGNGYADRHTRPLRTSASERNDRLRHSDWRDRRSHAAPPRSGRQPRQELWKRLEEIEGEEKGTVDMPTEQPEESRSRDAVWVRTTEPAPRQEPAEAQSESIPYTPSIAVEAADLDLLRAAPEIDSLKTVGDTGSAEKREEIAPETDLQPETTTAEPEIVEEILSAEPEAEVEDATAPDIVEESTTPEVTVETEESVEDAVEETATNQQEEVEDRPEIVESPDVEPTVVEAETATDEVDEKERTAEAPDETERDRALPALELGESVPAMEPVIPAVMTTSERRSPHGTAANAPAEPARHLSLALHAGKNITRLRSSNLRLIPGLEFAPLRSGEQSPRQTIAPLINEPVPHLDFPERPNQRGDAASRISIPIPGSLPPLDESAPAEEKSSRPMKPIDLPTHHTVEEEPSALNNLTARYQPGPAFREEKFRHVPLQGERQRMSDDEPIAGPIPFDIEQAKREKEPEDLSPLEELARRLEHARIPAVEEEEQPTVFEPSIVSETLANILVAQGKYAEALKAFQTLARMKPDRYAHWQERIIEMKWRLHNPGSEWPPDDEEEELEEE